MIIEISDDELLELVSLGIKSGSYHEADISVALMADFAAPDLFVQLIGKTFVDSDGYLWVTPEFVVPVEFQQVVDYAFWQILAQAPDEALIACGIHRDQIQKVSFQAYGRIADPESTYQNYSQDIESDWKWGRQDGVFRLEIFPDLLWRFSSLFEINAEEAVFSTIPESIGRCSNLRKLVLRRGKFRMLPASIGNLSNLNHLSITHSEIQVLPESVSRLSGLTYLNLSCCWLTVLPRSVTRLTNLRHLNMFENRALREVHTDLYRLYNLEYLNLRGCSRLIPSELRTEYLNFVSVLNVRRRIAELAGIPFDVYQPVQQEPNRVLPPLPEPSGTSVVRKPISEPEQNRPATELICQLLESDEAANFMAGLRLLKSLYDMEVTEYVLNKIDVFRANQHQADEDDIPNLRQLGSIRDVNPQDWYNCYRAVIMFLVDPSSPVKRESDSWVTTLSELTLVVETEEDLGMISAFPGLRRLTLSSVNHLRHLDLKQINLPHWVSIRNITADTISLAGQKKQVLELTIQEWRQGRKSFTEWPFSVYRNKIGW